MLCAPLERVIVVVASCSLPQLCCRWSLTACCSLSRCLPARDVIQKTDAEPSLLTQMERLAGGRPALPGKMALFKTDAVALPSQVIVC